MRTNTLVGVLAAVGIIAAVAVGIPRHPSPGEADSAPAAPVPAAAVPAPASAPRAALPDFATLVQQNGPAVVNIAVAGTRKAGGGDNNPLLPFFRGFPFGPQGDVPVQGQGSGFIVGADGIVLTNAHVVNEATEVTVKLTDRREFRAKVLGADPATDIAVLRIEAKGLPVVQLGDPAAARVGDWVVAIGSPFGFENSVSAGIISAKGRSLPGDAYVPFLQTDVAVNPGNSGGPLFNLAGEVIGINAQIYSQTGGYQGLAFAIPINVALKIKDQIVATGHASHARLGVSVQEVNQALAKSFGLERAAGALVSSVAPGSGAAKAGLQPGDVITKYNGKPIEASGELSAAIGLATPGAQVKLEIVRKGERKELEATLGEVPREQARHKPAAGQDDGPFGLAVRPLTPEERKAAKVDTGVLVEGVSRSAARAGMQPGDIILMADGMPVMNPQDLRTAAKAKKSIALLVQRGDERAFVPLPIG